MAREKPAMFGLLLLVLIYHSAEGCGFTTTALQGTVQSPNYPSNYSDNQNCVFSITAPDCYQITLTFTAFDLQANCSLDVVEIRDGDSASSPILGRYCGSSVPGPVRSFGSKLWIKFTSDGSITRRGFRATYTSAYLQAPFFLFASNTAGNVGGSIHRMDVETRTNYVIPMASSLYRPIAVDYDPVEQTIYWTEVGQVKGIRASALSGSGMHTVLRTGDGSTPDGLAVDCLSRLIFYTDTGRDVIGVLTMSNFAHKTIINSSLDQPRAIVLDTKKGVMFWTDWGMTKKIEKANYDGSNRTTLVNTGLYYPNGLALDLPNNHLYWVDAGTDRVERCDLDGGNRKVMLQLGSSHHFFGLAREHQHLYMTDWYSLFPTATSMLIRYKINTTSAIVYATSSGGRLNDIHVVEPKKHCDGTNGCKVNNGGCGVFCFPTPNNGSKCTCPDGQTLSSNRQSCV
ncbi:low-density lipoprotein receptor-related protein 6-like [Babylonia areolata]|uniref:low-density lipoprotein receptor-related protein 6-like n=1 Tax=Babylonia areolata TaxID=304850 RepID=UPI003FD1DDCD